MAYASWSVVFGEQPSASKWNILGTNDASFNDGTGIGTNAIAAASLATSAITLGYTSITGNVTLVTPTSDTLVTGLTSSVTIPAGSRRVQITAYASNTTNTNANASITLTIWDGTVGSGTQLSSFVHSSGTVAADGIGMNCVAVVSPSAGAKTYNVGIKASAGNPTVAASATAPAFILVKAI